MFKKPKKIAGAVRKRKESGDDDNDESTAFEAKTQEKNVLLKKNTNTNQASNNNSSTSNNNGPKNGKAGKKKKEKPSVNRPIATCFDDEEQDDTIEIFKVKKSSQSRRIAKQLKKERKKELKEESGKQEEDVRVILNGDRALDMELDSDNEDGDDDTDQPARHAFRSVLERGEIPDANMIHLARKKRAQAREQGDFIPLNDTQRVETPPAATARLVREEDHDLSEDEDRVDFSLDQAARERQRMKDTFLAAEHGSDESEHETETQWEEQQIRKAVGKDQMPMAEANTQQQEYYDMTTHSEPSSQIDYTNNLRVDPLPETVTITQVKKRLQERLDSLQQIHRVHTQELDNVTSGLQTSKESAATLNNGIADSLLTKYNQKYKFYQETRAYVRDLLGCFNEKFDKISELDMALMTLLKTRSEKLCKRRQEDIRDETSDCSSINKVIPAADTPVEKRQQAIKQRRTADRAARRSRRRRSRADLGVNDAHNEGLSSDDEESPSDVLKFSSEQEHIAAESHQLFDDVLEEFTTSEVILSKFQQWKMEYGDEYNDAYVGLCLPKLLSPLIKLSLIHWNPLEESTVPLSSMLWYRPVVLYGSQSEELFNSADSDNGLLPSIVEKVLIPKLTGYVEMVWDPMSTSQTRCLTMTLRQFAEDFPSLNTRSIHTQKLLTAVVKRLDQSLDEDTFMPLYSPDLLKRSVEARSFLHRQFWASVKLLRNILSFSQLLSDTKVKILALDSLLNRYILLGLQCAGFGDDAMPRLRAVVDCLPHLWFKLDHTSDKTLPQLENLCRFINTCAKGYYEQSNSGSDAVKRVQRENLKGLARMLIDIHALDHAKNMSEDYSFRMPK